MTEAHEPTIFLSTADVFTFLDTIAPESLDGVLTDVPFPTTERFRAIGTTTRTKQSTKSSNRWYSVMSIPTLNKVLDKLYDKMKPNSYAFIYVDEATKDLLQFTRGVLQDLLELNDLDKLISGELKPTSRAPRDYKGFSWWTPFVRVRVADEDNDVEEAAEDIKLAHGTGYHGKSCFDRILCLEKGKSNLLVNPNNVQFGARPKRPKGATLNAQSPKPENVAERLARAMSAPGGTICDPFLGSGTHAMGIVKAGCDALCNDIDTELAIDWLEAQGMQWETW